MIKQTYNSKVIISLVIGLLAMYCGFFGCIAMYNVGTSSSVDIPTAISVGASIIAIVVAVKGMKEIETHKETQKGRRIGIVSIALSALNFVLLIIYYASY